MGADLVGSESVLAPNENSEDFVTSEDMVAVGFDLDSPNEKLPPMEAAFGSFSFDDVGPKLNADELDPKAIPGLAATGLFGVSIVTVFSFSCDVACPKLNVDDPVPKAVPEFAETLLLGASFAPVESVVFPKENVPGATAATGDFAPNIGIEDGAVEGDPNEPNRLAGGPDFSAVFSGSGLFDD